MDGARARARSVAEELTSAWLAGDYDAVSRLCAAHVSWWTPLAAGAARGPADAGAVLRQVLSPLPEPVTVTAVVPSDDGGRCVVELRSAAGPQDGVPAFVTSVLTISEGEITTARTYTDVPARGGQTDAAAS